MPSGCNWEPHTSPVVVGGIGGSGTRVVAQLLIDLGFNMGSDLNASLDDLGFTALFKRLDLWPLSAHTAELTEALCIYMTSRGARAPQGITLADHCRRTERLIDALAKDNQWRECGAVTDRLPTLCQIADLQPYWGWKEPNTSIVLPFLLQAIPEMKYIHVVRDGRDMALSSNKNQLQLWGEVLLGRRIDVQSPEDALDYWCVVHERIFGLLAAYPQQVLLIKLESLLDDAPRSLGSVVEFLGLKALGDSSELLGRFTKPRSLGRFRDVSMAVTRQQIQTLERLG